MTNERGITNEAHTTRIRQSVRKGRDGSSTVRRARAQVLPAVSGRIWVSVDVRGSHKVRIERPRSQPMRKSPTCLGL